MSVNEDPVLLWGILSAVAFLALAIWCAVMAKDGETHVNPTPPTATPEKKTYSMYDTLPPTHTSRVVDIDLTHIRNRRHNAS